MIEYGLFSGRNVFLVSSSLALQAATAALLITGAWRARAALTTPVAWTLCCLTAAYLFSASQIVNFARGWNIHWFLAWGGAVWSFWALWRASAARDAGGERGALWFGLALGAAVLSSGAMANGLLSWPILLLLALRLRLPRPWLLVLAIAGAGFCASYWMGYNATSGRGILRVLSTPLASLSWLIAYLGAPLSWNHPIAGRAVGAASLALAVFLAGRELSRRQAGASIEVVYAAILLLTLGTGLMTAIGRMPYSAGTWAAPRYQTVVLPYWLSLFALTLFAASRAAPAAVAARPVAAVFALAWTIAVILPAHFRQGNAMLDFADRMRTASLAVVVGIDHRPAYVEILPLRDRRAPRDGVQSHADLLRARRLGMFADGMADLLGERIGEGLTVAAPDDCDGELANVEQLADPGVPSDQRGLRLSGWASGPRWQRGERWIAVSDEAGRVIGLGKSTRRLGAEISPPALPWVAFSRPLWRGGRLEVWVWLGGDVVCRIAGPVEVGPGSR